jgi:hypothetical protein
MLNIYQEQLSIKADYLATDNFKINIMLLANTFYELFLPKTYVNSSKIFDHELNNINLFFYLENIYLFLICKFFYSFIVRKYIVKITKNIKKWI